MVNQEKSIGKKHCIMDIATSDVITVPPTMRIIEGISMMTRHSFRRLPIADPGTGNLRGIITVTDIINLMGGGDSYNLIAKKHNGNLLAALNDSVRSIATESVDTLTENATIKEAAEKLVATGHGSFPIVSEGKKVSGIVTEYDILKALKSSFKDICVKDVMTVKPTVITPDIPISKITQMMVKHGYRRLPIVKDNLLIGIVTATDIMKYLGTGRVFSNMQSGMIEEVLNIPVRDVMTAADIKTATSDMFVSDAAALMLANSIGAFPVMDGESLTGIVTEFDLVKAFLE